MPPDNLRVLIVGDNPLVRAGLAALLTNQPGLNIVGQAATDSDLTNALTVYRPDVLAWDMGWDAQRSLEIFADVRDALPPALVLLSDETRATDALNSGAPGILLHDADADTLTAALNAIAHNLIVIAPALKSRALPMPAPEQALPADALTPRELEVLNLVAEGLPNKIIAARLAISEHTVKFHVNAVMSKLGAQSRTEAVVRATRLGLINL